MASRVGRFAALTAMMLMERIACSAASSERGASSAMSTIPLRAGTCAAGCNGAACCTGATGTPTAADTLVPPAAGDGDADVCARAPTDGSEVTLSTFSAFAAVTDADAVTVIGVAVPLSGDAFLPSAAPSTGATARAGCIRPSRSTCATRTTCASRSACASR